MAARTLNRVRNPGDPLPTAFGTGLNIYKFLPHMVLDPDVLMINIIVEYDVLTCKDDVLRLCLPA